MKFDKIVRTILLEARLGYPETFGNSSYKKDPEQALLSLNKAYDFLKKFDVAGYNHSLPNSPQDGKLGDALLTITKVIEDSNLDTYNVDRRNVNKNDLIKSTIKLASQFGQTEFQTEKNEHAQRKRSVEYTEFAREMKKEGGKRKNTINEKGPYIVQPEDGEQHDIDGNIIPVNEPLSGTDYRLSIFRKTGPQIRMAGGLATFHYCYEILLPMIGVRFQPAHKGAESVKHLPEFQNIEYETLYWWGENSLPFRSLITVSDGFVKSVPTPGNTPRSGLIQFNTDQKGSVRKARPFCQIGKLVTTGVAHGDAIQGVHVGDPIDEVKTKMESGDFDPIVKELNEIKELRREAAAGDAAAKKRIVDAYARQKAYSKLIADGNWQEIKKIYDKRANHYWSVYNDPEKYKEHSRRGLLTDETSDPEGWPFFHLFKQQPRGGYKPVPVQAKEKYEFLYPKNIEEIKTLFYKDKVDM